MSTIHFSYTVPPSNNPVLYRIDKYANRYNLFSPSYRYGFEKLISWPSPIYAPLSITYNLLCALKMNNRVRLYDWRERNGEIKLGLNDILLVHPNIDNLAWQQQKTWKIDRLTTIWRTIEKKPHNKLIVIVPYNHPAHSNGWLNEIFDLKKTDLIVICGEFWTTNWELSAYSGHIRSLLRVDMAINATDYPLVKRTFNPPGKRGFLYIGNTNEWKNTKQLEQIAKNYPNFKGGYISAGEIKGWKKIANFADITPEFMQELAQDYDFFLSASSADAQATTILEQMCFGLGIACTPESGYTYDSIIRLDKDNTSYNCEQIELMQYMNDDDIKHMTKTNRDTAIKYHNWELFCSKIIAFINQ